MIKFTKMEGLGNDYVYIDCYSKKQEIPNESSLAKIISDRHFGIGADGLILICKSEIADFKMRMFNNDGSEAEMCGNGIRCVGKFVYDKHLTDKTKITVETLAGIKELQLKIKNGKVEKVTVDMGKPILQLEKIPVNATINPITLVVEDKKMEFFCVSMGNPHAVTIIKSMQELNIEKYGPKIEKHEIFPNKTNVEWIQIVDREHIIMRVWERGTGETLACGTGACASVVAGIMQQKLNHRVTVSLLGGELEIIWNQEDEHVYMTGPARTVFEGEMEEKQW